jgi:broad specificity phosphatase PhoE
MHAFMADAIEAAPQTSVSPDGSEATGRRPFLILARHGKPSPDRSVWIDREAYRAWWAGYDAAGLAPGEAPPQELLEAAAGAPVLVASTLRRALETAQAVCHGRCIAQDPIFVEARLPPPPLPRIIRLRPGAWGVIARIAWWLGYSGGEESRRSAEKRAQQAACQLIALAERHGGAMLVAHGWFNRMMRPVLLAQGWECVEDGGDDYWSFRRYERR